MRHNQSNRAGNTAKLQHIDYYMNEIEYTLAVSAENRL